MPLRRALRAVLCLGLLTLTACASPASWPPKPGSCIEANIHKRAKWQYRMHGQVVTREEVERALGTTKEIRAKLARARTLDSVVPGLAIPGALLAGGGAGIAGATRVWPVVLVSLAGVSMYVSALLVMVTKDDPFYAEVNRYNEVMARQGMCKSPADEWTGGGGPGIPPGVPAPGGEYTPPRYGPPPLAP